MCTFLKIMKTKKKQRNLSFYYLIIIVFITLCSCKGKDNERKQIVRQIMTEWKGKTIIFPENVTCKVLRRDTVVLDLFQKPYKILMYVDSAGCTSCSLRIFEWKRIIMEADSIAPNQIGFLFYFHPNNLRELDFLLISNNFDYPVFIDENNLINSLNNFPDDMTFQTFLLDNDNKVLGIGNPTRSPGIWELYKKTITGDEQEKKGIETRVEVIESNIKIPGLEIGKISQAVFVLRNTGSAPLIISDIQTSCGCVVPDWDKSPVEPKKETEIMVEIKPE